MSPLFIDSLIIQSFFLHIVYSILAKKDICWFNVSVHNSQIVHCSEAIDSLDQHSPNLALSEVDLHPFAFHYHFQQIPTIRPFHHHTKHLSLWIDKCFSVWNHIWMRNTCQNPNFIYRILFIFLTHRANLHLLHCIQLRVFFPLDFEHFTISPISQLFHHDKVIYLRLLCFFGFRLKYSSAALGSWIICLLTI